MNTFYQPSEGPNRKPKQKLVKISFKDLERTSSRDVDASLDKLFGSTMHRHYPHCMRSREHGEVLFAILVGAVILAAFLSTWLGGAM